jgi:NADH-quinone oxidoreductase subunit N
MNPLFLVSPLVIIGLSAIAIMISSAFKPIKTAKLNIITIAILIVAVLLQLPLINENFSQILFQDASQNLFNGMIIADSFSAMFNLLFTLGTLLTLAISHRYLVANEFYSNEFFSLILFSLFGMMLLAMSYELVTAFIALETASLAIYILIGIQRNSKISNEAFFKYLLIGSFAGSFFLIGTLFIYLQIGSTHLTIISEYIRTHNIEEAQLVFVGGALIMITILFKIGAFLFHTWVLDVYDGASMPVMMFMSATFKIAIFSIALRIFLIDFVPYIDYYQPAIESIAFLTLIGGSLLTLRQHSIKRMLAASSIVHSGYLLIALASLDKNYIIGGSAIVFYLLAYFLSSVGALGLLSYISVDRNKHLTYESFKGFSKRYPLLALAMSVFMLSLAGFPSTIGFIGKFYIFSSGIASEHYLLVAVGLFAAFVSIYYYFKLISVMYFYPSNRDPKPLTVAISPIAIVFIALLTIWGGIGTGLISFLPGADHFIEYAQQALISLF